MIANGLQFKEVIVVRYQEMKLTFLGVDVSINGGRRRRFLSGCVSVCTLRLASFGHVAHRAITITGIEAVIDIFTGFL